MPGIVCRLAKDCHCQMAENGSLSPGVEFFVDAFQPGIIDMSINLGGGDIGMAEHHLHRPEIGAVAEEMAGEGVT
jgi:hypothetical protein